MAKQRLNNGGPIKKWKAPRGQVSASPGGVRQGHQAPRKVADKPQVGAPKLSPAEASRRTREMEQGTHDFETVRAQHKSVNKSTVGED